MGSMTFGLAHLQTFSMTNETITSPEPYAVLEARKSSTTL